MIARVSLMEIESTAFLYSLLTLIFHDAFTKGIKGGFPYSTAIIPEGSGRFCSHGLDVNFIFRPFKRRKTPSTKVQRLWINEQLNHRIPNSIYMGVSKNSGTPKSSILIGFSIIYHPFWGTTIFGNTHMNLIISYDTAFTNAEQPSDFPPEHQRETWESWSRKSPRIPRAWTF